MRAQRISQPVLFACLDRRDVVADFGGGAITSDADAGGVRSAASCRRGWA